jgi:hypothetical protein
MGVVTVNAQEKDFGVTVGFTSINFKNKLEILGEKITDAESFEGFYIGIFKEFNLADKLLLHPELQVAFYNGSGTDWEDTNLTDIILPVLLQYNFAGDFSALVGPRFDYIITSDDVIQFNEFGLGIEFGAQYEISPSFFVNLRASLGLTDRVESTDTMIDEYVSSKSQTANLSLGYRF